MDIVKVNLAEKFAMFSDHFSPRVVGELNGQQVKLVKFGGPFVWHHHEHEDEMFLVISGTMLMHLRDQTLEVTQGEFVIIPRGVEHMPDAQSEVEVLLFEPATTLNTGNTDNELTKRELEKI